MRMFNSAKYNDRMKFICRVIDGHIESNESIDVNAGGRCDEYIVVSYSCIAHHKYNNELFYLPPELMWVLTDATVVLILKEILAIARSNNG